MSYPSPDFTRFTCSPTTHIIVGKGDKEFMAVTSGDGVQQERWRCYDVGLGAWVLGTRRGAPLHNALTAPKKLRRMIIMIAVMLNDDSRIKSDLH